MAMVDGDTWKKRRYSVILAILLLGLLAAMVFIRLHDIEADPPSDFSASGGYWADEGFWTHNARNRVLFGTWSLDGWNNMYVSPILHWFTYGMFRLHGVSLKSARLVPIFLSILGILLLTLTLARVHSVRLSLFMLVFLGCQYPYCIYNRIAIVETPATFFVIVGFCCLSINRAFFIFAGGAMLAAAVITKSTLFFLLPAAMCSIITEEWLSPPADRVLWRRAGIKLVLFILGATGPLLTWWFFLVSHHGEMLAGYNRYYRGMLLPFTIGDVVRNIVTQPFHIYFNRLPILMVLAHIAVAVFIIGFFDHRNRPTRFEIQSMFFWVSGVIFLSFFSYRPFRYYVPVIPFMVISTALLLDRFLSSELSHLRVFVSNWSRRVLFLICIGTPFLVNTVFLFDRCSFNYGLLGRVMKVWPVVGIWYPGMVFVVLTVFFFLIMSYLFYVAPGWRQHNMQRVTVAILLSGFLVIHGALLIEWRGHPTHVVRDINHYLDRFPPDGAFTGQWAGELCLATRHRVIPVFPGFVNDEQPFERYCIRYALLWEEYGHTDIFFLNFPEISAGAKHLDDFQVKDTVVHFFAFPPCTSYEKQ